MRLKRGRVNTKCFIAYFHEKLRENFFPFCVEKSKTMRSLHFLRKFPPDERLYRAKILSFQLGNNFPVSLPGGYNFTIVVIHIVVAIIQS